MGRYYNGDIEGKFWFAVQSSNDADFFGVEGSQPSELYYFFDKSDLPKVNKGIRECNIKLDGYKQLLKEYFKKNDSYNDISLAKYLNVTEEKVKFLLEWYARLKLGIKIRKCSKENDCCEFTAEC